MTNTKVFSCSLLLTIATLFLLNSTQTLASAEKQEPYETVTKFCSQKNDTKEREFCFRTLKSDTRSATAKDIVALLLISDDLASQKLNQTRGFLANSCKKEGPNSKLKECLNGYDYAIMELRILLGDLKSSEPRYASYDALLASDGLNRCKESLEKNQIKNPYVLRQNQIDLAYVNLVIDISNNVS